MSTLHISALTVSCNYSDLLEKGIAIWLSGLERLIVVTSPKDSATLTLCAQYPQVRVHQTLAFYERGAIFNKALAICEAVEAHGFLKDWNVFFDSDMIPPSNWRQVVEAAGPRPGFLYGAKRVLESGEPIDDRNEIPGWFQLFHASDRNVQHKPILDTNWKHAGGADSYFHLRWPSERKVWLPMTFVHQGAVGRNWCGRGNNEAMDALLAERARTGKIGAEEKF